ncbi:MAG: glycosyltransferase family 4 protein [Nitrospiraceae bacterium]
MRRVLVLINNSGVGGTERRLGRLFARLASDEKDTVFVINQGLWTRLVSGGLVPAQSRHVIRWTEPFCRLAQCLPWAGDRTRFWVRKLDYLVMACRLLIRYGLSTPRLFHVVLGGAYVALPLMVMRRNHRYIVSVTDPNLAGHVGSQRALALFRAAISRSHAVDALTEEIGVSLAHEGIEPSKIAASTGSVVDVTRFHPSYPKEPWVVFAGRLVEEKNPLLFLEAVPAIQKAIPDARFFIFGDGPLKESVRQGVARGGLTEVVTTGFVEDLAPILARASVFVSLQRRDNYPSQVLLEAMASGMASVATDTGCTWRLVDQETGVRIRSSASDIANAVIALLLSPDRCRHLGEQARQRVMERHSETGYRQHLRYLYALVDASRSKNAPGLQDTEPIDISMTKP